MDSKEKGRWWGGGRGTLHRKKWKINIIKTTFIKRDCRRRILSPCRSGFCLKSWRAGNKNSNCAQARGWANGSTLTAQFSTAAQMVPSLLLFFVVFCQERDRHSGVVDAKHDYSGGNYKEIKRIYTAEFLGFGEPKSYGGKKFILSGGRPDR